MIELFPAKLCDYSLSSGSGVRPSIVKKQGKSASKHASPFVPEVSSWSHNRLLSLWLCLDTRIQQAKLLAYPKKKNFAHDLAG